MTYSQIKQIEEYIKEASGLKNNITLKDKQFLDLAKTLEGKLLSGGFGYVNKSFNWNNASVFLYTSVGYDNDIIRSNLEIIIKNLEGILNALPYYGVLTKIRADIERGNRIKKLNDKRGFITEMSIKYKDKIDFGKALQTIDKVSEWSLGEADEQIDYIIKGVLQKMEIYLEDLCNEKHKEPVYNSFAKQPQINIAQINSQNVSQSINLSFEDCFKSIDDCETLSEDEINEIKGKISEIQELLKDKKGKKKSIREKLGSILNWLSNKGTDIILAVLPYVVNVVQSL